MRRATISRHHPLASESPVALNSFDDLLLAFLYARADLKSASRDRTSLQHLYPAFTGRLLCELNPVMVRQYIRQRQAEKASASSINKEIGLLSRAVNYANLEWGAALDNPVCGLKQREPEGRVRWLTKPQAAALVACAGRLGPRAAHLPAVITLALNTGMRKGELAARFGMGAGGCCERADRGGRGRLQEREAPGDSDQCSGNSGAGIEAGCGLRAAGVRRDSGCEAELCSCLPVGRDREFSLPRFAPHLRVMAGASGRSLDRGARSAGSCVYRDDGTLCASGAGAVAAGGATVGGGVRRFMRVGGLIVSAQLSRRCVRR